MDKVRELQFEENNEYTQGGILYAEGISNYLKGCEIEREEQLI